MKKHVRKLRLLVALLLALSLLPATVAYADDTIRVTIDGATVNFDVPPQAINGRTMVPLRAIFEALGAKVDWVQETQSAVAVKDGKVVIAILGSTSMYVDDVERVMDVAPVAINGRTLVPARFVAEAFNCNVDWDDAQRIVKIETGGGMSGNRIERLARQIENHYNNLFKPSGNYACFESECVETATNYEFILRYQMSDEEAFERVMNGGMVFANVYTATVFVDKTTGAVSDEWGWDWWFANL